MVCGFTGHRPEKLPWGSDETDSRCEALKLRLRQLITQAIADGAHTFVCGMARGCDFYFAEAVLELKAVHDIRLEVMLPCAEQSQRWREKDAERYRQLLLQCDGVYLLQKTYSEGCMLRRNRAMADRCQRIISVWDGSSGGTGATVQYAKRKGIEVIPVWL